MQVWAPAHHSSEAPLPRPPRHALGQVLPRHPRPHSNTLGTTPGPGAVGDGCGAEHPHPSPASVGSEETESRGQSEATGSGDSVYHSRGRGSLPYLLSGVSRCLQAVGTWKCQCPGCPSPLLALAGQGAGAEGGDPKSVLWHGPTAEPCTGAPCHVRGVPRGAGGQSHPGPRPPPHLSGRAGSPLSSASGVSGAVPGESSGEMAASPDSPRPPHSDMARAGTEQARIELRQVTGHRGQRTKEHGPSFLQELRGEKS